MRSLSACRPVTSSPAEVGAPAGAATTSKSSTPFMASSVIAPHLVAGAVSSASMSTTSSRMSVESMSITTSRLARRAGPRAGGRCPPGGGWTPPAGLSHGVGVAADDDELVADHRIGGELDDPLDVGPAIGDGVSDAPSASGPSWPPITVTANGWRREFSGGSTTSKSKWSFRCQPKNSRSLRGDRASLTPIRSPRLRWSLHHHLFHVEDVRTRPRPGCGGCRP